MRAKILVANPAAQPLHTNGAIHRSMIILVIKCWNRQSLALNCVDKPEMTTVFLKKI